MSNGTPVPVSKLFPGSLKRQRDIDRAQAIRGLTAGRQTLYALRLADGAVKIGCTSDLAQRRRSYLDSEVLAFTFGDYEDERAIHDGLRASVLRGREYYHATPKVLAIVNEWRDAFGLPHLAA